MVESEVLKRISRREQRSVIRWVMHSAVLHKRSFAEITDPARVSVAVLRTFYAGNHLNEILTRGATSFSPSTRHRCSVPTSPRASRHHCTVHPVPSAGPASPPP